MTTAKYCPYCGSDQVTSTRPHDHQLPAGIDSSKAFVCLNCGLPIAWPAEYAAMQTINNIERCSRIFIENEAGEVTICYQGYDIDGNEVAILSQDEFRQWLRAGFVELLVEDEPAGRIE